MKRIKAFGVALLLVLVTIAFPVIRYLSYDFEKEYSVRSKNFYYTEWKTDDLKQNCIDTVITALNNDPDCIPVFGSSEFSFNGECTYPKALFQNGNSDFNMFLIGTGGPQSLKHATTLSSIADSTDLDKIVLVCSPQWFYGEEVRISYFTSHFSYAQFERMLRSEKISTDIKQRIVERSLHLLETSPDQLAVAQDCVDIYFENDASLLQRASYSLSKTYRDVRYRIDVLNVFPPVAENETAPACADEIFSDFDGLLEKAEQQGKERVGDNRFCMDQELFDTNFAQDLEGYQNSATETTLTKSKEYDDLRLFLDICKELDLEVLLINVPVNGLWYDYLGLPKSERDGCYQRINEIAAEYGYPVADFTSMEYEPYFLEDASHLGWKGWAYVDKEIYEFAKQD